MKRETRPRRYDGDAQGATRRDTVPAAVRFSEDSSPASSAGPARELQRYPALRPHADEATVKYSLMQDGSAAPGREDGDRASDLPPEFRSGTRVTPTSPRAPSTTPPASHVKSKAPQASERLKTSLPSNARITTPLPSNARIRTPLPSSARITTPLPRSEGHYATPSVSFAPPPKPISVAPTASAPLASARRPPVPSGAKLLGTVVIALVTIVLAAVIGATLGDGSLQRLCARLFSEAPKSAPALTPNATRAPPASPRLAPSPRVVAPAPQRSPSGPATSSAPSVRFEDLAPEAEPEPAADPSVAPAVRAAPPRVHQRWRR